jgi:DHA1 family bicyclomycin/chloramphenicol resistance-like MFS transporter
MLGAASGLSPFGVTILVPLLGMVAADFNAGFGQVQFLISAYLFGLATAQPFNGYLCDRFGRRPVLLTGFSVFIIASFMAAWASSLNELILLRFLQAAGVSVGTVAARAVVRDTRSARGTNEALAYIAACMGFAPILAPMFGGWLGSHGGYPGVFIATGCLGLGVLAWMWLALPETLHPDEPRPNWRQWMRNYGILLRSGPFWGYTMIFGFVQGCFFAFLAVGADVFKTQLGIDELRFGVIWGLMAITYVISAVTAGKLYGRFPSHRIMDVGIVLVLCGGALAFGLVFTLGVSLVTLLLPMGMVMLVAGAAIPGAMAGAVNQFPRMAGTAAGLSSAMGIVLGGCFTVIGGSLYRGDYLPVAALIATSATLTALSWALVRKTAVAANAGDMP